MKKKIILGLAFLTFSYCYSQCYNSFSSSSGNVFKTTGNAELDGKFSREKINIDLTFGVATDLYIIDDRTSPNALAGCDTYGGDFDGTVWFGKNLLVKELYNSSKGEIAIAGILAHEIAHVVQCYFLSPLKNRERELQADFLAGYYLGVRGDITLNGLRGFFNSLYEAGDWSDPTHHGTPTERVNSMLSGFNLSGSEFIDVYNKSLNYFRKDSDPIEFESRTKGKFLDIDFYDVNIIYQDVKEKISFKLNEVSITGRENKTSYLSIYFMDKNKSIIRDKQGELINSKFPILYTKAKKIISKTNNGLIDLITINIDSSHFDEYLNESITPILELSDSGWNIISEIELESFTINLKD